MEYNYKNKVVGVEPTHTNWNDYLGTYNINVPPIKTVYFFHRNYQKMGDHINPIVNVLTNSGDWRIDNPEETYPYIVRQVYTFAESLKRDFDVLLSVKTDCEYLTKFYHELKKHLIYKEEHTIAHEKIDVSDIYEYYLPDTLFNHPNISEEEKVSLWNDFEDALHNMVRGNKAIFSFKYLEDHKDKEHLCNHFDFPIWGSFATRLHMEIDGKDVLILDDTTKSGGSWSKWAEMTWRMFEPRSITIVNFFTQEDEYAEECEEDTPYCEGGY